MDGDEGGDWEAGMAAVAPLVPGRPAVARLHIKKRALRNKALSVGFDDKRLQDFVGGFHRRKKKRRKEAQKQLLEKDRLRRIEARKKRKLEKESALHGGTLPEEGSHQGETGCENDMEGLEDDERDKNSSISGTKTYQSGDLMITVTTSELSREDDEKPARSFLSASTTATKKQNLCVKTKPMKEIGKQRAHRKPKKHGSHKKVKKGKHR